MGDTDPTRRLLANTIWQLRQVGYRLDWAMDVDKGWRFYALRRHQETRLTLTAPPKERRS